MNMGDPEQSDTIVVAREKAVILGLRRPTRAVSSRADISLSGMHCAAGV